MFWIHGGGYSGGSGYEPRHNGDFLPLKGVVLVTINYRLGVFGFLATYELAKEQGGSAGNYGLMDMVAAPAVGQGQHQEVRRRSRQRDHLRRERRLVCRKHADGVAHGARAVSKGHRRKRRARSAAALNYGHTGRRVQEGRQVGRVAQCQIAGRTSRAAHADQILEAVKQAGPASRPTSTASS